LASAYALSLYSTPQPWDSLSQTVQSLYEEAGRTSQRGRGEEEARFLIEEVDFVKNQINLDEILRSRNSCIAEEAAGILSDLNSISTYFSVSNEKGTGADSKKMLIKDAYPDQKKLFVRRGLESVKSRLTRMTFCQNL